MLAKTSYYKELLRDYQKRFCFECKHFDMSFGEPDLSEITPGSPPSLDCYKGHFYVYYGVDLAKFKKLIRKARECDDFEPVCEGDGIDRINNK